MKEQELPLEQIVFVPPPGDFNMSKKYIIKLENSKYNYLRANVNNYDVIMNPLAATTFSTKQKAKKFMKDNINSTVEFEIKDYAKACEEFNEWFDKGMWIGRNTYLNKKFNKPYNNESPEEILEWRVKVKKLDDEQVDYENYKTWPDLYSVFDCLHSVEAFYTDRTYKNIAITIEMSVTQYTTFEEFEKDLKKALPYVETKSEDKYLELSIFDHYLSEGGNTVSFLYKNDKDCKIEGRWSEHCSGTLEEVFEYWRANRYCTKYYD